MYKFLVKKYLDNILIPEIMFSSTIINKFRDKSFLDLEMLINSELNQFKKEDNGENSINNK